MLETFVSDPILYPYELLNALRNINRNLHQECCERPDGVRELIITADNNPRLFRVVDAIIARAPRIKGWRFIALRPPMEAGLLSGLEMQVDGENIRMSDIWFTAIRKQEKWGIIIFLALRQGLTRHIEEVVLHAVTRLMGEREFHEKIKYCRFLAADDPSTPDENKLPILHLAKFMSHRK